MSIDFFKAGAAVFVLGLLTQGFQNCAPVLQTSAELKEQSSEAVPTQPVDHPGVKPQELTARQPLLANRRYIAFLIEEVFSFSGISEAQFLNLRSLVNEWINKEAGVFGYPCDPKVDDTHCSGTILAPMDAGANSLRTAYKMQLCRAILNKNEFVEGLIVKVAKAKTNPPDGISVSTLFELFYRGDKIPPQLLDALLGSDKEMILLNPNVSVTDRWRYMALAVCESPGWELL